MKKSLCFALFVMTCFLMQSQDKAELYEQKVSSIDSTITTLYAVISGEKGEERNWDLMKHLFHSDAKLIPSGFNQESDFLARYMTVDDYISASGKWLTDNGFFEKEIHREVNQFGNIAQVFSTYEAFNSETDEKPFMRGINSIQMLYDGSRWWIINIFWMQESPENPIPENYLPKTD
jgi:hypothetical protein